MVRCLDCRAEIKVGREFELDAIVVCKRCGSRFVVIDLDPVEIDYVDDDDEDFEDDDWDDDWDEDDD